MADLLLREVLLVRGDEPGEHRHITDFRGGLGEFEAAAWAGQAGAGAQVSG